MLSILYLLENTFLYTVFVCASFPSLPYCRECRSFKGSGDAGLVSVTDDTFSAIECCLSARQIARGTTELLASTVRSTSGLIELWDSREYSNTDLASQDGFDVLVLIYC